MSARPALIIGSTVKVMPGLERQASTTAPVVQHLRLFMKAAADAVPAELAHHGQALLFGMRLDRVTDIAQARAGPDLVNAAPHALIGEVAQTPGLDRRLADIEHPAGVAVEAVLDHCDVDVDHVARLELLVARNSVADDVIDGSADGFRKRRIARWRVIERRGHGALHVDDVVVTDAVELGSRHARADVGRHDIEHLCGEAAGDAHGFDISGGFDGNGHGSDGRAEAVSGSGNRTRSGCFQPRKLSILAYE